MFDTGYRRPAGARRLEDLCIALLIKHKGDVGNVGDLPLHTLEPFLHSCEAAELGSIEDCTREGGRDLAAEGQNWDQHWHRCCMQDFGVDGACDGSARQGDWRRVYKEQLQELEAKERSIAERVRRMRQEATESRISRSIQVVDASQVRPKRRARASPGKGPQPLSSRGRILKKLGMPAGQTKPADLLRPPPGAVRRFTSKSGQSGIATSTNKGAAKPPAPALKSLNRSAEALAQRHADGQASPQAQPPEASRLMESDIRW